MSETRLRADRLIAIFLLTSVFALFAPVNAQDENMREGEGWGSWKDLHKQFMRDEAQVGKKGKTEYLNFWRDYVGHEFADGANWQFRDNTHSAKHIIERSHKYEGSEFERWGRIYDRHQVEITKQPHQFSDIALSHITEKAVDSDSQESLFFAGISPTANKVHVVFEQTKAPHKRIWEQTFQLEPNIQFFEARFKAPPAQSGAYSISFELGDKPGNIILTHPSVRDVSRGAERTNLVKTVIAHNVSEKPEAEHHEKKPVVDQLNQATIAARIADCRRGELIILVRDKAGNPVSSAKIDVAQIRHYFLFGCGLDGLKLEDHSAFQRNYQQRFVELFNYAKLPCYWNAIESRPGVRDFSKIEAMTKWCLDHEITPNGFGLVSPYHCPRWAPKDFRVGVGQLRATVTECIRRLGDRIHSWDVVDEISSAKDFAKTNVLTEWLAQDKEVGVIERALLWAQYASGERKQTFIVNEITGTYVRPLFLHNSLPEGIGLVCGMQNQMIPINSLWKFCNDSTTPDREFHMTDLAVLSGECRPSANYLSTADWPSTKDGEAKQADYVSKLYSVLFSSPKVRSISWRDLSDQGAWMGAPGGLLRRDGTPKPAYYRLMDLIHKEWWTNTSLKPTHEPGAYSERAFFGDYKVTVRDDKGHTVKKTISFTPASRREANIVTIGN